MRSILPAAILLMATASHAQWAQLPEPPDFANGMDITFMNAQEGLIIGTNALGYAKVMKTYDGGQTWSTKYQATIGGGFQDIDMLYDGLHGIIGGGLGLNLYTEDGGENWQPLDPPFTSLVMYVAMLAPDSFAFSLQTAQTWYSYDGGATFQVETNFTSFATWDALNDSLAFRSTFFVFQRTVDGGITWQNVTLPAEVPAVLEASFTSDSIGCVRNYNKIACTTDGGQHWHIDTLTGNFTMNTFALDPSGLVVAGGVNNVMPYTSLYYSTDTGHTFIEQPDNMVVVNGVCTVAGTAYALDNAYPKIWKYGAVNSVRSGPPSLAHRLIHQGDGTLMLSLDHELTGAVVTVHDPRGALLLVHPVSGTRLSLSLADRSSGVYVVQVHSTEGSFAERVVRP